MDENEQDISQSAAVIWQFIGMLLGAIGIAFLLAVAIQIFWNFGLVAVFLATGGYITTISLKAAFGLAVGAIIAKRLTRTTKTGPVTNNYLIEEKDERARDTSV